MDKFDQDFIPVLLNEISYAKFILDQEYVNLDSVAIALSHMEEILRGHWEFIDD